MKPAVQRSSGTALGAVTVVCLAAAHSITGDSQRALLFSALPAATLWAILFGRRPFVSAHGAGWTPVAFFCRPHSSVACIRTLCFVSLCVSLAAGVLSVPSLALASMALSTTRLLSGLPGRAYKLPWENVLAIVLSLVLCPDAHVALGLSFGSCSGGPLQWAAICCVLSSGALIGWSIWFVKGDHGPIQDALGSLLTPLNLLPIAISNAIVEEIEFRLLLGGGLWCAMDRGAENSYLWLASSSVALSVYFAALHVAGGFPSGLMGGGLVFLWSLFLCIMRWWTGGLGLVLLLHVQADVVIFTLVLMEESKIEQRLKISNKQDSPCLQAGLPAH